MSEPVLTDWNDSERAWVDEPREWRKTAAVVFPWGAQWERWRWRAWPAFGEQSGGGMADTEAEAKAAADRWLEANAATGTGQGEAGGTVG